MKIEDILKELESFAPLALQEEYDNAGLITGNDQWECTGVLVCLDATELVIAEAVRLKCNLVLAHHPIIFKGIKKFSGENYVQRTVIKSIKDDVAIYAIHTNLDNIVQGVNAKIAFHLGIINAQILQVKTNLLRKLAVFVPVASKDVVLEALFVAGAGSIGRYSECSFIQAGIGSFKPGAGSVPHTGEIGVRNADSELKIEVIFPQWKQSAVLAAMWKAHPYEEVAYDIYDLQNQFQETGSGMVGELEKGISEGDFLALLQEKLGTPCIKHTAFTGKVIKKIAFCGGSGSFLINDAIRSGADVYVTSDLKYHEYFDADGKILLIDVGHYESEQFTQDLLFDLLRQKFHNFAVLKTSVKTNPVHYFTGR